MYTLTLLAEAQRDLAGLDPPAARRIAKRLIWLAEHFEQVQPEALTGELGDFFKLRVGDYRVLYKILHTEKTLQVYRIRHRREIYKSK
jgi:mRNA interferase RelE/StbE